jgi:DNA-binding response OmpR family regulator
MKILVIDDDPAMTEMIKILLEPVNLHVITSNKSPEGVQIAKSEMPDLIILDLMMPRMDGWEICKAIRAFASTPILILSALDDPGLVARSLNSGADDFLVKPVQANILLSRINMLLRRNSLNPRLSSVPV